MVGGISNLTQLTMLSISEFLNLKTLNLSDMSYLECISNYSCHLLQDITLPATLRTLRVGFCGGLKRVTGTDYPTQIECIDINECPNLEELPSLARLKSIIIDSCVAGIGECSFYFGGIQGCIRKLKSLPSVFNLIGKAANGAMSNFNPSLLPEAISCTDPATLFRTLNDLKGSLSAIIVCSLADISGSAPLPVTEMIHGKYLYERPGQWMITTVIKDQHYEAARLYSSML